MTIYMGLDVHCKRTSYCVQDEAGKVLAQGSIETTEAAFIALMRNLKAPGQTPIALESGTQSKWLAQLLSALNMAPKVIDAHEVRSKSSRRGQKSDTRDAWEICDGLRRNQWTKIVWIPTPHVEQLRRILSRRQHFVRLRTSQVNAAKFLARQQGMKLQAKSLGTQAGWVKLLASEDAKPIVPFLKLHMEMWRKAESTVGKLDKELAKALKAFKEPAQRMCEVFGIGPVTSASLIAALGDPHRFDNSAKVVSYLGCAPSTYDSGDRQRRAGITKQGPAYVRAALCEAAQQARRIKHPLNPYWSRLAAKSGRNCATMAVAARLAKILWRMWRDGTCFDIGKLNVIYKPMVHSRQTCYSIKSSRPAAT